MKPGILLLLLHLLLWLAGPLHAEADFPWSKQIPGQIAADALHPDTVLDEQPCDWRPVLVPLFRPLVADCTSPREAVLRIASSIGTTTGVYYSMERRKPEMNALEALAEKKVSCTGQSILLVCALRSIGIPARAAGILTWNHIQGNHTWAEAWFDGAWHMIEFDEKDFNTPWVLENIGMLDPRHPYQRVMAATPSGKESWIPAGIAAKMGRKCLPAEDVSERYLSLARDWYARAGIPADTQRLLIDFQPRPATPPVVELINEQGGVISAARLPSCTDDVRYFCRLLLPRSGQHYLRLQGTEEKVGVAPTSAPVQILRLGSY